MKYEFNYRIKPSDLWQASMYYAYSSYLSIINIICIVSSIALLIKLWPTSPGWLRGFLILFLSLFTVIQPVVVYIKSSMQLQGKLSEIKLEFTEEGLTITADGVSQDRSWRNIKAIVKKPTILILYMNDGNGYILRNSVLKNSKTEFYQFTQKMISNNR